MPSDRLEPGAPAPRGFIPLAVPNISGREWEYVKECLDTGWVSSAGDYVDRFEQQLAAAVGARYAVAAATGTAALHVALLLAGVGKDDEVVVPSLTFIAPANAVRYVGAWPTFVDVDPLYFQLDTDQLEAFLREDCRRAGGVLRNRHTGRRVVAILPVDLLGHPCDLDRVDALASEFRLRVIEDATESLGARYRGHPIGGRGALVCFSFNGNKLLTTGGGGMIVTDDGDIARAARYLTTQAKDDPLEFVHRQIGFNYRLTNVQAAIGCAQLEQLERFVSAKRSIAARYDEALATMPGIAPMRQADWAQASFWLYTVLVDEKTFGMSSRTLMRRLESERIQTRPLWQPLHQSPAHAASMSRPCPVSERHNRDALSLPCSTGLTAADQSRVIAALRRAVQAVA